eukprot:TRINITY_DN111182_c0_g1_i1.p1 TRINITY_DN111182_c0_g1~~TRINITY_DN111182_c0_g1_i1.p1  ORF type:complete len:285 (-),score=75.59 TRINITY_DN111182_c0_g1_i1:337-1191(-)
MVRMLSLRIDDNGWATIMGEQVPRREIWREQNHQRQWWQMKDCRYPELQTVEKFEEIDAKILRLEKKLGLFMGVDLFSKAQEAKKADDNAPVVDFGAKFAEVAKITDELDARMESYRKLGNTLDSASDDRLLKKLEDAADLMLTQKIKGVSEELSTRFHKLEDVAHETVKDLAGLLKGLEKQYQETAASIDAHIDSALRRKSDSMSAELKDLAEQCSKTAKDLKHCEREGAEILSMLLNLRRNTDETDETSEHDGVTQNGEREAVAVASMGRGKGFRDRERVGG